MVAKTSQFIEIIMDDVASLSSLSTKDEDASDDEETITSGSSTDESLKTSSGSDSGTSSTSSSSTEELLQLWLISRMHSQCLTYAHQVFSPIEQEIEWGRRLLIQDISESEAITEFRFR